MSKTINDYTAAVSIDATNDYFLLEQGGVYVRINRSIMLGISGSPVGTSDSQALTNKTIGNTNTVTVKTGGFTLQDASDATKQAVFSLAGITTATTRTLTVPNASVTLASLTGVETFTNKTLTSPVINGGSIDNTTVTVDSIAGHSSSTVVTVAGLQISSGVLNTANAVTATSIADGAVQPKALVAGTGSGWTWQSFTPAWTNLTVGNGTSTGRYIQIGKTVFAEVNVVFNTTSAMGTPVSFALPVTAAAHYATDNRIVVGKGIILDAGTAVYAATAEGPPSTTAAFVRIENTASTYNTLSDISSTVPMIWGTADGLTLILCYEAA